MKVEIESRKKYQNYGKNRNKKIETKKRSSLIIRRDGIEYFRH